MTAAHAYMYLLTIQMISIAMALLLIAGRALLLILFIQLSPDNGSQYLLTLLMISVAMALLLIAGGALLLVLPVHHRLVHHITLQQGGMYYYSDQIN